jgi:phytoene dehydrogenase-like protein
MPKRGDLEFLSDINIIGAGVAGLSAGCYGQMNGYRTHIFEMHTRSGGLCTSWQRKGYIINGCIHWFMGAGPRANYYQIWEELGAVQGKEIVYYDEVIRFEDGDGKVFNFYTDIDRLEQHMKELAPEDTVLSPL